MFKILTSGYVYTFKVFYRAVQRWPEKLSGVRIYIGRWEIKRRNFATKTYDFDEVFAFRCIN